jgi:NAD-dependent SIR2 family protein deacetylase
MSEAIAELQKRKKKVNCIYKLIDDLTEKYSLGLEQKLALTFALWL